MKLKTLLLTLSLLFFGITTSTLADFNDGYDAYQKGDYKTAESEWRSLAEQGNASAQFNLALMYGDGKGVLKDPKQAFKWYQKAADQGDAKAQNNLGWMYENAQGILNDPKQAFKWYQKAADQGLATAQYKLGWMYAIGDGVFKDMSKAKYWTKKSYEGDDAEASKVAKENWDIFELWKY